MIDQQNTPSLYLARTPHTPRVVRESTHGVGGFACERKLMAKFALIIEADDHHVHPAEVRLRQWLKLGRRAFGLRASWAPSAAAPCQSGAAIGVVARAAGGSTGGGEGW